MEESFELLSSMSPRVKGRQKTLKIKKSSKLALKKHFRRSSIYDRSHAVRNENLQIVEVTSESSESVSSSRILETEKDGGLIVIDSTDSEEDLPQSILNSDKRVQHWLEDVEAATTSETFYSQVSTIMGDIPSNVMNGTDKIAVCSSFNDQVVHRFDELFIDKEQSETKKNQIYVKLQTPKNIDKDNNLNETNIDDLTDESFSLGLSNLSLTSRLMKAKSEKFHNEDVHETLMTSDESNIKTTPDVHDDTKPKIPYSISKNSVLTPRTPSNISIQEVESMLDSLYGATWRKKQHKVLLPLTEPKKKPCKETSVPKSEKVTRTSGKGSVSTKKPITFDKLKKPVQSPWIQKLKGLVDSDSDSQSGDIAKVKVRLDFSDDEEDIRNKENDPNNVNKELVKKSREIETKKVKTKATKQKSMTSSTDSSSEDKSTTDEDYEKELKILEIKRKSILPQKNKAYTFLESLSGEVPIDRCDSSARIFRYNFKQHKEELTRKLFGMFNKKIFDNSIPGDTELEWNTTLRKTAGMCYCRKITHRNGNVERKVRIALSTKVVDSPDRLRDTLVHEMCHAATWIVNQISDGHGPFWKSWAFKAMETFPELPAIKRCHAYTINSKYTYKCTSCGYSFGRHSKSLDVERKRCGLCHGKFEVLVNKQTKSGVVKTVAATPKKEATGFALFVKENYARYKDPSRKHGDVMKVLGQKFAELKVKNSN